MNRFLETIGEILIEEQAQLEDYGLLHGKMGIALLFYELSVCEGGKQYEVYAERLLEECLEHMSGLPFTFSDGLHGVGWGVQYLLSRQWIEGDSDVVLFDVDSYCWQRFFEEERSYEKWMSCALYFQERISYREQERQGLYMNILRQQIIYVIDDAGFWLEKLKEKGKRKIENNSDLAFQHQILWGTVGLIRLHQLNIFNYKVEKVIKGLLEIIAENLRGLTYQNKTLLSIILNKAEVLVCPNFNINSMVQQLKKELKEYSYKQNSWSVADQIYLSHGYYALGFKGDFLSIEGVAWQDITDLREKKRYGLWDGLAGLGWGLRNK